MRRYRPEPRPVFWCLRVKHDAPDHAAIGVEHLVVVCWIAGKTCSPKVESYTHQFASELGDHDRLER
jgi:hypothetical protein